MIHRIAQVALALVCAGLLQPAAAQDFRGQFSTQTALLLALLSRDGICPLMGRFAGMFDEKKSQGMNLAWFQSRLDKVPEDLTPDFSRQLITVVAVDVFSRPGIAGPAIAEEMSQVCAAQLSEQLTVKSDAEMPEDEREALKAVMSKNYVPLGAADSSRKRQP